MVRYAKRSIFSKVSPGVDYPCDHPWPECFIQCGDSGLVFSKKGNYTTAFFEAFPRDPDTFIRGQGKTIKDAENDAWEQWERVRGCPGHEFERRGYENGAGFCKHCGFFKSKAFPPSNKCCICGEPTYYTHDIDKNWYCEDHADQKPKEKWTKIDEMIDNIKNEESE